MKTQKLKVTLNEVKRMQELAGIVPLYESVNEVKQIIKEEMTIDKIKHYMDDYVYKYWTDGVANNSDLSYEIKKELLNSAKKMLESEIEQGILKDIKYQAELNLINSLLR